MDYKGLNDMSTDPYGLGSLNEGAMTEMDFTPTPAAATSAGPAPGAMMAAGMFINMFSTIISSVQQNQALHLQADYQTQQLNFNSKIASINAQNAIDQGNREAQTVETKINQVVGKQRQAIGASGIDVNSGSAMALQEDARTIGALDVLTIKNNANMEAWGYKVQAVNNKTQSAWGQELATAKGNSTLLTGGINALGEGAVGSYYGFGGKLKDIAKQTA